MHKPLYGSFDENGVSAAFVGNNGDSFIEELVEVFDTNGFVVAVGGDMNVDVQKGADGLEKAFECAAVVDGDEAAEAYF